MVSCENPHFEGYVKLFLLGLFKKSLSAPENFKKSLTLIWNNKTTVLVLYTALQAPSSHLKSRANFDKIFFYHFDFTKQYDVLSLILMH